MTNYMLSVFGAMEIYTITALIVVIIVLFASNILVAASNRRRKGAVSPVLVYGVEGDSLNDDIVEEPLSVENSTIADTTVEEVSENLANEETVEAVGIEDTVSEATIPDVTFVSLETTPEQEEVYRQLKLDRSFKAKLIQTEDETKNMYITLKNELLSYKGVRGRISWRCETFRKGRLVLAKFGVRGKTLCLYLYLNPSEYIDSKYKVEEVPESSASYVDTPLLYRIRNEKRMRYAKELIAVMMEREGIEQTEHSAEDYSEEIKYRSTPMLIEEKLIRVPKGMELPTFENYKPYCNYLQNHASGSVEEALFNVTEPVVEPQQLLVNIEEVVAVTETFEENVELSANTESVEDVFAESADDVAEKYVYSEEIFEEIYRIEEDNEYNAQLIQDENARSPITRRYVRYKHKRKARKLSRTVSTASLNKNFGDGETVTLSALIEKKIVPKGTVKVKVLMGGDLDKALIVEAYDFSEEAEDAIIEAGGSIVRIK